MNLPFHLSIGGSHISISMCESDDGVSTSCRRQCSGIMSGGVLPPAVVGAPPCRGACTLVAGAAAGAPRPRPRAGAGPSGTICALVTDALSNLRLARLSQGVADAVA